MEQNRENAVWQRVTAAAPEPAEALEPLLRESAALAAAYAGAASRLTGSGRQLARKLWELERSTLESLQGIGMLSGQLWENLRRWEPAGKDPTQTLKGCYHRTLACRAEYTARSLDSRFGEVYRRLAERSADQLLLLTQLLGTGGKP